MAFLTLPAAVIGTHATAEGLTAAQAQAVIAAVPQNEWPAMAEFAKADIHSFAQWTTQFPLLAAAAAPHARFIIRVIMDGVGGLTVVTA